MIELLRSGRRAAVRATIVAVAVAGAVVVVGPAPSAGADELSYLQALNAHGFVVYDTAAMLGNGYAACEMMNTKTGDVVAAEILYRFPSEATVNSAATLVIVAAQELCPWHWHPAGAEPVAPPPPPLLRAA